MGRKWKCGDLERVYDNDCIVGVFVGDLVCVLVFDEIWGWKGCIYEVSEVIDDFMVNLCDFLTL